MVVYSYETISVNIAAGNDPTEISGDITSTGNEDNQLKGVITLSDIDGLTNGSIVAISSTTSKQPQRGEAVIVLKGKDNSGNLTAEWTYTPQDNVHGDDQFTVVVTDDAGFSHEEVIKVTITSVDDKPLVSSGIYASAEKGARNENNTAYQMIQGAYLATDTDTTANTYSPVLLYSGGSNAPANGTVSAGVNTWSYTPTNPTNNDQFTVSVRDNEGNETEQVINLSFYHVDTEATFQASEVTISGSEDSTLSGNITIQDTDGLNTEKLAVTQVSPTLTGLTLKDPVKGSNTTTASVAWEYKPDATSSDNTEGNLSFTIEVNDDLGGTTSQVVNLIRYPINEVATASQGQSAATSVGSTAKATDTLILNDPDDNNQNTLNTYALVDSQSKNGKAISMETNGKWEYTPTGEQGYDYFLAKRTDKRGFETVQAINLYLGETAAATNLISGDVSGTAKYDSTSPPNITGSLGTESITGTFEIIDEDSTKAGSQSRKGAAVSITNTGEWTYTPATDFSNGNDFFLVKFTQNITGTETIQAVNIFISPVDTPTLITSTTSVEIQEDSGTHEEDITDSDNNDNNTYSIKSNPQNGTASINSTNKQWTYKPNDNYAGDDYFTLEITDNTGKKTAQAININIKPVNDITTVSGDTNASLTEDSKTFAGTLTLADIDKLKEVIVIDQALHGTATITDDSVSGETNDTIKFTYIPSDDFNGEDKFNIAVIDELGSATIQTINLTIQSAEDEAIGWTITELTAAKEDTTITGIVYATDVDGARNTA